MNISPITNQNQSPSFNAKIIHNGYWSRFKTYLQYYKGREGYHDTTKELKLVKKIEKAFNAHPSDATLRISEVHKNGHLFGSRGMVESEFDRLVDVEPSREDGFGAIEHLLRKVLNPLNKDLFNRLIGEGYEYKYDMWWSKHIRPIWNDIVETFREETVSESENHPLWDEKMNILFRERNAESVDTQLPQQNKDLTVVGFIKHIFGIE